MARIWRSIVLAALNRGESEHGMNSAVPMANPISRTSHERGHQH
jgi:hypothetical protein